MELWSQDRISCWLIVVEEERYVCHLLPENLKYRYLNLFAYIGRLAVTSSLGLAADLNRYTFGSMHEDLCTLIIKLCYKHEGMYWSGLRRLGSYTQKEARTWITRMNEFKFPIDLFLLFTVRAIIFVLNIRVRVIKTLGARFKIMRMVWVLGYSPTSSRLWINICHRRMRKLHLVVCKNRLLMFGWYIGLFAC